MCQAQLQYRLQVAVQLARPQQFICLQINLGEQKFVFVDNFPIVTYFLETYKTCLFHSKITYFTQNRYLFNCGEGTQRLAHEHKTKLTKLEHIFVTRRSWHCFGGLPGLSLTIQDAGVSNISIHGPSKLDSIFHAMRKFVVLKNLNVIAPSCTTGGFYEDNVFKAHYILLR